MLGYGVGRQTKTDHDHLKLNMTDNKLQRQGKNRNISEPRLLVGVAWWGCGSGWGLGTTITSRH